MDPQERFSEPEPNPAEILREAIRRWPDKPDDPIAQDRRRQVLDEWASGFKLAWPTETEDARHYPLAPEDLTPDRDAISGLREKSHVSLYEVGLLISLSHKKGPIYGMWHHLRLSILRREIDPRSPPDLIPFSLSTIAGELPTPKWLLTREEAERHARDRWGVEIYAPTLAGEPEPDKPAAVCLPNGSAVTVTLPHMTEALEAIIRVMQEQWGSYDPDRPPKQVRVAEAIDQAIGWTSGKDGPSRNARAIAAVIKPDSLGDE